MSTDPESGPEAGQRPVPTVPPAAHPPRPPSRPPAPGGVAVGRIVDAEVSAVLPSEVEVRLVDGRTGVIPRSEFDDRVAVGDKVEAALLAREDPRQRIVLSRSWAISQRAWESVEAALAAREPLRGTISRTTKGGAVVDVGVRAFLPTSLFPQGTTDASSLVGTDVEVLVVEADRTKDRVVVSVRDLERRRRRLQEKDLLRALEPDERRTGRVVSTADHGAVVDLGGVRGLVHRSELTWGRLSSVEDVVKVGDEVEVVVLDVNRSKRRVSLSIRRLTPDPYRELEVGSIHSATVTRVVEYGAFVRIDPDGAEGLVHVSEIADVPGYRPDQLVAPGETVMVKVLDVDRKRHRVSLSIRRVLVDD